MDAHLFRGTIYGYILNNYGQAIRDFDTCIQLDPKEIKAYYYRGICYLKLKNYRQAIQDYTKAIELNPTVALYYTSRSVAYDGIGDRRQAIKDIKIAAKLGDSKSQNFLKSKGIEY